MGKEKKTGRRRLKYIAILPSLITLLNALSGFIAIVYASRGADMEILIFQRPGFTLFALSGYMIFFAMIADVMDGRVARLSKTTSSFGGQLDSLSDAISFGVAPAFLMMKIVEVYLESWRIVNPALALLISRAVLFIAIVYVICAVIRLARFNVENEEDESAHMNFSGLPSPAAAGVVVSLVIFQQDLLPKLADHSEKMFYVIESATVWALPVVTLIAGILMVTRIRYTHVVNYYLRGKKSFATFLGVFFAGLLLIWYIQLAMVVGFCGFALMGLLRWICKPFRRKKAPEESAPSA
ncbi:MAG: CDP-alcohol phosphatidyltransferase family protein [Spirochaetaceae bacterium]|nr:CDP-alcohol phosphatidyltransferase family protein [Spirochaetaceae bacterium]